MTVYKKQDIPDRYHLKKHYRVPPLYLLADEGYVIVRVSIYDTKAGLRPNSITPTSPKLPGGDVTGLSLTCHGEVGVMELGLFQPVA